MSGSSGVAAAGSGWRGDSRALLLVIASAMLAYGASCLGTFVYDDYHSVHDNPAIRTLHNVPAFFADADMFSALDNRMYRPVLLVSYALNWWIGGAAALVFKLTNVLLHAAAAGCVWGLARRLGLSVGRATVGAVLFAVHPLASEAVNMVSGRSELLCIVGLLAGMHFHLSAMRGRAWAHWGTAVSAVVACGSKETGVVLPFLLLVLEAFAARDGGRRPWGRIALRLVPAALVVVGYLLARQTQFSVVTIATPSWSDGSDPTTGSGRDMVTQLSTMALLLPRCLGQALLPTNLSLDPPVQFCRDPLDARVLAGGALLLALVAWGLRRPVRRPVVFLGTALAGATAAPWVLIPLNVPLAEHRLYGPLAGLGLVAAGLCPELRRGWQRGTVLWVAGLLAASGMALSAQRSLGYRSEKGLWEEALVINPRSYRACYSIGACLMKEGDLAGARSWMERAIGLHPDYVSARKGVLEIILQLGEPADAERGVSLAAWLVERAPDNPFYRLLASRAYTSLGRRTGRAADFDRAVAEALHVLQVAPAKALVFRTAAHARRMQGDLEAAVALLDECMRRGLDHQSALLDRCQLLRALGRHADAEADLQKALQQDPFSPRGLQLLQQRGQEAVPASAGPSPR